MLLTIIIVGILSGIMLQSFSELKARVEKINFLNSLTLIQHMLNIKNILSSKPDPKCSFLKDPDLFMQSVNLGSMNLQATSQVPSGLFLWHYDPSRQSLTYFVQSKRFFHGSQKDKIVIFFTCLKGIANIQVTPHQWCQNMGFWGCKTWG